jgi:glycerol-3-phosphate acyltransferase PlsY
MEYLFLVIGYLCGSIPFGLLVARRYGVDIRKRGSGNIGFANVQRVLGWKAGLLTLVGDIIKGAVPVWCALMIGNETLAFWTGICAIAGHVFPVWLHGHGGKGVATGLGMVVVLNPLVAAIGALAYVITRVLIRNSARSSLLGIIVVLVVGSILKPTDWWQFAILLAIGCYTLRRNLLGNVPNYDI